MKGQDDTRRIDPRAAIRRDGARINRREQGHRSFWRSVSLIGMVGWPIALGTVGGSMLGRYLDARFDTGVRFTLMLLMAGLLVSCWTVWKTIVENHD